MNVKPLLKHFPELHHLPLSQQLELLQSAYYKAFGPDKKLGIWRKNIIGLGLLLLVSVILITLVGPAINLEPGTIGMVMMIIVFPLFIALQQWRYVHQLRPEVEKLLQKQQNTESSP